MKSLIYKFAFWVSIIAFVTSLLNGVTLFTSLMRSGLVFMATLFVVIISLNMLRWSLLSTYQTAHSPNKESNKEQTNSVNEE